MATTKTDTPAEVKDPNVTKPNATSEAKPAAKSNGEDKAKKVRKPMVAPEQTDTVDDIPGSTRKGHWDDVILDLAAQAEQREPHPETGVRKSRANVYESVSPTISSYLSKKYNTNDGLKELGFKGKVNTAVRNTREEPNDEGEDTLRGTLYVQVELHR